MKRIKEVFIIGTCLLMWAVLVSAWTYTYDTDTPLGSDAPSVIDDRIRETKDAIQERMDVCGYWPLTGTEVSATDAGKFRYLIFREPNDLTSMSADESALFSKDVSSVTEFHWIDESDNVLQLTSGGTINIVSTDLVGTLASNTYFTCVDNAGTGTTNLIKADANDDAVLPDGAELATSTAPTTDQAIANKKYVDDQNPTYSGGESHTFPGGLIFKQGYQANVGGSETITFGTPFPTGVVSCSVTVKSADRGNHHPMVVSGFTVNAITAVTIDGKDGLYWQAWGY